MGVFAFRVSKIRRQSHHLAHHLFRVCGFLELHFLLLHDMERPHLPLFGEVVRQALRSLQRLVYRRFPHQDGRTPIDSGTDKMGCGDMQPVGTMCFRNLQFHDERTGDFQEKEQIIMDVN